MKGNRSFVLLRNAILNLVLPDQIVTYCRRACVQIHILDDGKDELRHQIDQRNSDRR